MGFISEFIKVKILGIETEPNPVNIVTIDGDGLTGQTPYAELADEAKLLIILVKAGTATIPKNKPVYITSYNVGGWYVVEEADASNSAKMPSIGLTLTEITTIAIGKVAVSGRVTNSDTSSYSQNAPLYVAPGGGLQITKPQGTDLIQKMGVVARVNPTVGVIQLVGAGRTNDLPNLPDGKIWMGDANGVPQEYVLTDLFNRGGVAESYNTIALLLADQANQTDKEIFEVLDASGDLTVDSGYAFYEYLGTTVGDMTDYRKLSEEESIDINGVFVTVSGPDTITGLKRFTQTVTYDVANLFLPLADRVGGGVHNGLYFVENNRLALSQVGGTKGVEFDFNTITAISKRTYILPDADGTLALVGDIQPFSRTVETKTGTSHLVVPADKTKIQKFTSNLTINVTVNTDSLTDIGDAIEIDHWGTGPLNVVAGTATLLVNPLRLLITDGQYSRIAIQKMSATEYRVYGELEIA